MECKCSKAVWIPIISFVCLSLLALTAWLGFKARNEFKQYKFIGIPIERNTITVMGEGKVTSIPDIATVSLGTTIERPTVAAAQAENSRIMNEVMSKLADFGVEKKDIQTTSYGISPQYNWDNGKQTLRGYNVSQNVLVKIRNLDNVGDIIGAAGQLGANQVGSLDFTVDNPDSLQAEARIKALEAAKVKAQALSQVAGVTLVRVINFQESTSAPVPGPRAYDFNMAKSSAAVAPPVIEGGSTEVIVDVTVTYEIE